MNYTGRRYCETRRWLGERSSFIQSPIDSLPCIAGHCVDKFLGRPNTAPVLKSLSKDEIEDAKKSWDKIRFGDQTGSFKDVTGRYAITLRNADRANGIQHITYNDNPKTHPLIKYSDNLQKHQRHRACS
jgi:hypothetical protein